MSSTNNYKRYGLGDYLQGVQHFGVTVNDMAKSMEFYTEVLGGKLVVSGDGFLGEVLHNTLFQKEELKPIQAGKNLKNIAIPDIREGNKEVLDIRFISFGNVAVELLHFRDAKLTANAPNWNGSSTPYNSIERTCVGYPNIMHLSFHVKDDIDLNQFAQNLEEECRRRDIDFSANRIIRVKSEEERRKIALKYMANKFWNDPNYFVEGYSDSDFGDFYGWSLFYAKGPNGEQLEFNQVTRKIRGLFMKAQAEYNQANRTNFQWPSSMVNQAITTN
jgi:catechol 2,3-dioxygenase-like lactoylglutathione lyase family enzyme